MKFWPFGGRKRQPQNSTLQEAEWWRQNAFLKDVSSGAAVNYETVIGLTAVWACVRILSESVASLPVFVYQRQPDGSKQQLPDHPLHSILHVMPNREQTSFELLEWLMASALLRGTAYAQIIRDGRGQVMELQPLHSYAMHPRRDELTGQLLFDYEERGAAKVTFRSDEIWRIAGLGANGVTGYSPITLARQSLGVAIAADDQAARLFKNNLQSNRALEVPAQLSDEAYERLKDSFGGAYEGSANAWKTVILEEGTKLTNIGFTPEDSQFLETRKFQVAEIARWFRVPLHMLNELDRSTFSNIEHQSIEFVQHTLRPWLKRIEASIQRDLVLPNERARVFTEFELAGLLRGDIKTRYEAYSKALTDGWLSPNEVRALENRNRVEGLDEYRVPLNMGSANTDQDSQQSEPPESAENLYREMAMKACNRELRSKGAEGYQRWMPDYFDRLSAKMEADGLLPSGEAAALIDELTGWAVELGA